jgi:glutaredoxin-related protein
MLRDLSDRVRVGVGRALSSTAGDRYRPLKLLREVLGTANDLTGRPFCSAEELARRRQRQKQARPADGAPPAREAAPVMLYFDGQDHRTLKKMEELLRARDVPFRVLDVTDDESTRSWAATAARMHEFPLLFIAGEPVGGLHELTRLDVNGGLKKRVFG